MYRCSAVLVLWMCPTFVASFNLAHAVIPPTAVTGKEYSQWVDADAVGTPDFEQSVFWDGTGGAIDTFDYTPVPGPVRMPGLVIENPETDALAHDHDVFFQALRDNKSDLIFSTDMDGSMFSEDTFGAGAVWATPSTINSGAAPRDVDGIELWGPDSTDAISGDDAFNYSLESRPPLGPGGIDPGGVSVWHVPGSVPGSLGATAFPLISVPELAGAILGLAPDGTTVDLLVEELDLDGMMLDIQEYSPPDHASGASAVRIGRIHFTIDPIVNPTDGSVVFDGGEIFTWDFSSLGPTPGASFLSHGGHLWDTAFPVMATFGTASENVNGIESVSAIPEPSSILCIGVVALGLMCWKWKRS